MKFVSEVIKIRVLIYGAGVLGRLYAYLLQKAQCDVTLLARGKTFLDIQERGIQLFFSLQNERVQFTIPTVDCVSPEDEYDTIFVVMQKNQISAILPTLAAVKSHPDIIFLGNNGTFVADYCPPLNPAQVLLGFPSAGGMRVGDEIEIMYSSETAMYLGEIDGSISPRLEKYRIFFEGANIPVKFNTNIDAWLKYHIALVSPFANALIAIDCDNYQFAETPALLEAAVRGIRESFRVLRKLGYPINPKSLRMLYLPLFVIRKILRKRMKTRAAEIAMAGHAKYAQGEMQQISDEFRILILKSGVKTPWIDYLCQFLDPTIPRVLSGTKKVVF